MVVAHCWPRFHRVLGIGAFVAAGLLGVAANAQTPAEIAVQAIKENDPASLSFSDWEFILGYQDASPANKEAAQKVWQVIQNMQKNGMAKLKIPVKIIAVEKDGIDAAITDENRNANKPDLHVTRFKQMSRPPAPGAETHVVGAISSYRPRPFLFIMDEGELMDTAGPATRQSRGCQPFCLE